MQRLPEKVVRIDAVLDNCVNLYGYGHMETQRTVHSLAITIIAHSQKCPHDAMLDLLWKKCQYGPFDHHRRLLSDTKNNVVDSKQIEACLHVAIGYQVTMMSGLGGMHAELLSELDLPCGDDDGDSLKLASNDALLCAKNAIHLGDLFRYKSSYKKDLWKSAMLCYQFAVKWQPDFGLAWNQLGVLLSCKEGHLKSAVFHFVKALDAKEPFLTARKNLIGCLRTSNCDSFMKKVYECFATGAKFAYHNYELNDEQQQFIVNYINRQ